MNPMIFDLEQSDREFIREVAAEPGGEGILRCVSCGTCTSGCPVRAVSAIYNPRRIIRMVLLGMRREVMENPFIWYCSSCYTCSERCPQDVKITDIMTALRNIAARNGFAPPAFTQQLNLILEMGRLYEIDDFDNKKRRKAGLPEITGRSEDIRKLYERIKGDR